MYKYYDETLMKIRNLEIIMCLNGCPGWKESHTSMDLYFIVISFKIIFKFQYSIQKISYKFVYGENIVVFLANEVKLTLKNRVVLSPDEKNYLVAITITH